MSTYDRVYQQVARPYAEALARAEKDIAQAYHHVLHPVALAMHTAWDEAHATYLAALAAGVPVDDAYAAKQATVDAARDAYMAARREAQRAHDDAMEAANVKFNAGCRAAHAAGVAALRSEEGLIVAVPDGYVPDGEVCQAGCSVHIRNGFPLPYPHRVVRTWCRDDEFQPDRGFWFDKVRCEICGGWVNDGSRWHVRCPHTAGVAARAMAAMPHR